MAPRDGSNIYHRPAGTDGVPNFPIESSKYNAYVADVEQDLNLPRPIVAGGTGANNATDALFNVKGEIATQIVTNWDSQVWVPGSFYAASTATGTAPVAGHAFAGQAYLGEALANPPTNQNVILEARDLDYTTQPGPLYVRQKKIGVWSSWGYGVAAAPFDALAYSGMQINGSMEVSQELGTAGIAIPNGNNRSVVDGWRCYSNNALTRAITVTQTAGPVSLGLQNAVTVTATTGGSYSGGGDLVLLYQPIEGYRTARLAWGTASAQSITIGFYVQATIAGTLAVSVQNSGSTRSYVANVVINAPLTWEYKTVTIPGDTAGTWLTTNGVGIILGICVSGSGGSIATPNTWTAANATVTASTTNFMATNGNVVIITGVVVIPGADAPSAARSSLIMRPYDQELLTCQRYYIRRTADNIGTTFASGYCFNTTLGLFSINYLMRSTPVLSFGPTTGDMGVGISGVTPSVLSIATLASSTTMRIGATTSANLVTGQGATLAALSIQTVLSLDARL